MKNRTNIAVIVTLLLAGFYLVAQIPIPRAEGTMAITEFGRLPCVADGREKPFDTLARNSMMVISHRKSFYDNEGEQQPAIRWLLDSLAGREEVFEYKIFRIDNLEVLEFLGLKPRLEKKYKYRYAYSEFAEHEMRLRRQVLQILDIPDEDRTLFQKRITKLWQQMQLFYAISMWHEPLFIPPLRQGEKWNSLLASVADGMQLDATDQRILSGLGQLVAEQKQQFLQNHILHLHFDGESQAITIPFDAVSERWMKILAAYARGDAVTFNDEVTQYQQQLDLAMPDTMQRASLEQRANYFAPFYQCMLLQVIMFAMVMVGLLRWGPSLHRAAYVLGILVFVVHSLAFVFRMYVQDRWGVFVTNLYSTAIFIGWGSVLVSLILERIYRNGIGTTLASILGFAGLLIAHNLASDGRDTMEMMQAVLDTNFWLATHVTTINFGYAATFVAGFLSIGYLMGGVFTKKITPEIHKQFSTMIYGTICFAVLLSFTGTVLGGIWADQSWGRFWGWDPKENGALMIVVWNAMILHARWGGMAKTRGIAALAVFGNIITAWSWFGVNELGVGLHSYGFTEGRAFWLLMFAISQLLILAIGLIPQRIWRSPISRQRMDKTSSPPLIA